MPTPMLSSNPKRSPANSSQGQQSGHDTTLPSRASNSNLINAALQQNAFPHRTPTNTLQRLEEIAQRTGAFRDRNVQQSGPYVVDKQTNTAIKVWYGRDGKPEKYELFKLDSSGRAIASNFFHIKSGGELKVAKIFNGQNRNGTQVSLGKKELTQAHRDLRTANNEAIGFFIRDKSTPDQEGFVRVNAATGYKTHIVNGEKCFELIDTQGKKSYFLDIRGKLLYEKDLTNHKTKYASQMSQESKERVQRKLDAIKNPKPEGASDFLFHTDGREIAADVKQSAQTINASMRSWLRGGNDDATFFKTLEGLSDEKRQDVVDAYQRMYGVDLTKKVKKEFWGSLRRDRAEALVGGDKLAAKSAELQQKIHDSRALGVFPPNPTKVRDAVGDVTRGLNESEASALREKHSRKYSDVNNLVFTDHDKSAVDAYFKGQEVKGDVHSLASENNKAEQRDAESVNNILERHAARDKDKRDAFASSYHSITQQEVREALRVGEGNIFTLDRNLALVDGDHDKALAIKLSEKINDGISVNTLFNDLDGVGKKRVERILKNISDYKRTPELNGYDGVDAVKKLLTANISGDEKKEVEYLLDNGQTTDAIKLIRATRGLGTADEIVKEVIERNKKNQLRELNQDLASFYGPLAGVDGIISSEVSEDSDLHFDFIEAKKYGEPATPPDKMAAVTRRYNRENSNRNWITDNYWSKGDSRNLDASYKLAEIRFNEYVLAQNTGSRIESAKAAKRFDNSYVSYQQAENTYRVVRHEAAESVASGVATVGAVAGSIAATAFTGGLAAPVALGVTVGAGGLGSFSARYTVRRIMEGDSYTTDDIGSDAASSVIDGVSSVIGLGAGKVVTNISGKTAANNISISVGEAIVTNGIEGGLSGLGTAMSEKRFWQSDTSEQLASLGNAGALGIATGLALGVGGDVSGANLRRLTRGRPQLSRSIDRQIAEPRGVEATGNTRTGETSSQKQEALSDSPDLNSRNQGDSLKTPSAARSAGGNSADSREVELSDQSRGPTKVGPPELQFRGTKEAAQLIDEYSIRFNHEITLGKAKITFSDAIPMEEGRVGLLMQVEVNNQVFIRSVYRSNSQGLFRALPARNHNISYLPGYDKGFDENALSLHPFLQKKAYEILDRDKINIGEIDGSKIIEGAPRQNYDYRDITEYNGTDTHPLNHIRKIDDLFLNQGKNNDFSKPQNLVLKPGNNPDFNHKLDEFTIETSLSGRITAEIYPSQNEELVIMILRDQQGRVWPSIIANKEPIIGRLGVDTVFRNQEALAVPLWEYDQQVPKGFQGGPRHPVHTEYVLNWPFIKEIPMIKDYYHYQGMKVPD